MTAFTQHTDLKFFTNTSNDSLHKRFIETLKYAEYFDTLVGYFRITGFNRLYESLETVEKIRILVGLNIDQDTFDILDTANKQTKLDFESHKNTRDRASHFLVKELDTSEDTKEVEESVKKFIEFIQSGKLEIKAHPSQSIHAKVYIIRYDQNRSPVYGTVVTGSSNFSESGLVAQREFNVELKDTPEVSFALDKFEELWAEAVDITKEYVDTVQNKTWVSDQITPYDIYLKFLYEYFKENINAEEEVHFELPEDFKDLEYQKEAVLSAKKILEAYNGVFLADVVGLGKTYISAMLLQQLPGRKLIICPPHLIDYWKETLLRFYVPGCVVESIGKLDKIREQGVEKYSIVLIDEAHRFRNELTQGYEALQSICRKKKVVLVSATPLNNKLADILSLIKLFQPARQSSIPGVSDLERFFGDLQRQIDQYESGTPEYFAQVTTASAKARDKVLKHLMVRRTRTEIKNYFSKDIEQQGLTFPEMGDPQRIIYQFDDKTDSVFNDTIELLKEFKYARYTPLLFLKRGLGDFELQQQRNVGGFMKSLLVKRLESSFYAFKKTVGRFIDSYEKFIQMLDSGNLYISKKINIYELLEADDEEELARLVEEGQVQKYKSEDFKPSFREVLEEDLQTLKTIHARWKTVTSDPKLNQFIQELKQNKLLKQKIIVFSESKETIDYLYRELEGHFPSVVLAYSSHGGQWDGQTYGTDKAKDLIKENYDPTNHKSRDDVQILLTTDILAEGINLHRSNIIINYDLPWNPTRVLQRVGRVNRVGTSHNRVYVFNFFPTAQTDEHLGLEDNIKAKIQAFHNTLGEDAKYLTEEEELSTGHGYFGDQLYRKLNDKRSFESDDTDEESELKYLKVIRDLRDDEPSRFEKIKRLPKKARTCRLYTQHSSSLLTFFRKGALKKFVITSQSPTEELTFLEAAKLFECTPETEKQELPQDYFKLLAKNKEFLDLSEDYEQDGHPGSARGGSSNEKFLIRLLKSKDLRNFQGFTDDEEEYLNHVRQALEAGTVAKRTSKRIKDELKDDLKPFHILAAFKRNIAPSDVEPSAHEKKGTSYKEVILSEYLLEGAGE